MSFEAGVKTRNGYLAVPASGRGPGVLVLHAWWGLNDFFIGLCDRLAREGFVAIAPDLYSGDIAVTIEEAHALRSVHAGSEAAALAGMMDALEVLKQHPSAIPGQPVSAIGFSMGAYWATQLATRRPHDIAAAVLFYGIGEGDFPAAQAAFLGHFAENDDWEPLDQVRGMEKELREAGKSVTFFVYPGAGHWFFEDDRPDAFNAEASALAWERTLSFLREHMKTPG